jgi:peptidoglycan/LPS O-acetylase OafA/YrhL
MPGQSPSRQVALDGLRGLAALLVVFLHVPWLDEPWASHITSTQLVRNGYLAVDVFFILSGFVITSAYAGRIASGRDVRDFLVRRFFRVYPLHAAILLVIAGFEAGKLLACLAGAAPPGMTAFAEATSGALLAANLALVQGLGIVGQAGWNEPSWSISCEFAAYVLFAGAVWGGLLRSRRALAAAAAAALLAYAAMAVARGTLDLTVGFGLARCLAGFALGMCLSHGACRSPLLARLRLMPGVAGLVEIAAATGLVLVLALATGPAVAMVVPVAVATILMIEAGDGPVARLLASRPVACLGRISYSLYLVHLPLLWVFREIAQEIGPAAAKTDLGAVADAASLWRGDLLVIGFAAAAIAVAWATHRLIEEPGRLAGRALAARPAPAPRLGVA